MLNFLRDEKNLQLLILPPISMAIASHSATMLWSVCCYWDITRCTRKGEENSFLDDEFTCTNRTRLRLLIWSPTTKGNRSVSNLISCLLMLPVFQGWGISYVLWLVSLLRPSLGASVSRRRSWRRSPASQGLAPAAAAPLQNNSQEASRPGSSGNYTRQLWCFAAALLRSSPAAGGGQSPLQAKREETSERNRVEAPLRHRLIMKKTNIWLHWARSGHVIVESPLCRKSLEIRCNRPNQVKNIGDLQTFIQLGLNLSGRLDPLCEIGWWPLWKTRLAGVHKTRPKEWNNH